MFGSVKGLRSLTSALAVGALALGALVAAPSADASPRLHHRHIGYAQSLGTTTVSTAPGIAGTLLKAGVLPLPVLPATRFGLSYNGGLVANYGFLITGNTADLAAGTGDILHSGGINFVSRNARLEIGKFDIDLAAGKVFATEVNFAPARVAVLDLDLSGLQVASGSDGSTVLSGIGVNLDPEAAGALNATFGLGLPEDGSLAFGSARVVIKG